VNICGKKEAKKDFIVGAFNASESAIADDTMMTPGPAAADGGYEEVLVLRVRRGGRYNFLFVSPPTGLSNS
jgi:hypothetical protein